MYAPRTQGPWLPESRPLVPEGPDDREYSIESSWHEERYVYGELQSARGEVSLVETYRGERKRVHVVTLTSPTGDDVAQRYEAAYDRVLTIMAERMEKEQGRIDFIRIAKEKGHM